VNSVIKEFLPLVGTQHSLTLAYSSQQNAIVERVNKEINRHIRAFTFEKNSVDLKSALPVVQRTLNAAYNGQTKVSAAQILFGNSIILDNGLFLPPEERLEQDTPLSVHMSQMLRFQDEVMTKAGDVLKSTDELHMASFTKVKPTEFAHSSYVLVKYRTGQPSTRHHTFWKGPLKVINNDQSEYLLYDLINNKEKPFIFTIPCL
jgi:transposase InsO family protein